MRPAKVRPYVKRRPLKLRPPRTQTEPRFLADMRANLTSEMFWEMSGNPDQRIPFTLIPD